MLEEDLLDIEKKSFFVEKLRIMAKNVKANSKKEEYKLKNLEFLKEMAQQEGVITHKSGVLFKVLQQGTGQVSPNLRSIVSVHYRGELINGREFDNSWERSCPEALRLVEVIDGWKIALQEMHVGDRWMVYIPAKYGYGDRASGPIPANSTLIFEIELFSIA